MIIINIPKEPSSHSALHMGVFSEKLEKRVGRNIQ